MLSRLFHLHTSFPAVTVQNTLTSLLLKLRPESTTASILYLSILAAFISCSISKSLVSMRSDLGEGASSFSLEASIA